MAKATPTLTSNQVPALDRKADHPFDLWLARLSEKTGRGYRSDWAAFAQWLATERGILIDGRPLTPEQAAERLILLGAGESAALLDQWQAAMRGLLKPRTINRRLSAVASFTRYARRLGLTATAVQVDRFEVVSDDDEAQAAAALTAQDVGAMLAAVRARFPEGRLAGSPAARYQATRDRLVLVALAHLGLRRFELTGLDLEHVDLDSGTAGLLWVRGKRGSDANRKAVALTPTVRLALTEWLEVRGSEPGPLLATMTRSGELMRAADGGPKRTSTERVRQIVALYARRAGLHRPVTPHMLRHAHAGIGLDATGGDIAACASSLRDTVQVAQRYDRMRQQRAQTFRAAVSGALDAAEAAVIC